MTHACSRISTCAPIIVQQTPVVNGTEVEKSELCRNAQIYRGDLVFYDTFVSLCRQRGISPSKAALDAGISKSLVTKWRTNQVKIPSGEVLEKLSRYFGIPISALMGESREAPALNEKDRRDIARNLQQIMEDLEHSGDLMFDGDPMTDEARESVRAALKLGLEAAKRRNKEVYTPNKYRKG